MKDGCCSVDDDQMMALLSVLVGSVARGTTVVGFLFCHSEMVLHSETDNVMCCWKKKRSWWLNSWRIVYVIATRQHLPG